MIKLENPKRLSELSPAETLKTSGLKKGNVFCDIGAGTGIFTVEAAKLTAAKVYAVDTSEEMLKAIKDKAVSLNLNNIELINPEGFSYPIEDDSCDFILMCTVLHEIEDTHSLMNEIRRILKFDGRFTVIDFHKKQTPMGPPERRRISETEVIKLAENSGFSFKRSFSLGDNFYTCVFKK